MFPDGLVKLCALFAAPRVAELVIAQRCLKVACNRKGGNGLNLLKMSQTNQDYRGDRQTDRKYQESQCGLLV